ncbi:hypothetical protein [Salinarimonas ramus]|uniref:hypothetical protein n=1 Tax=Salinarimonas ramus TaxID=690164 RepID=UPI00166BFC29|nr:hypothetical protein [Salinarimonas ramus]
MMVMTKPVGFHKGARGLAALMRVEMNADPFSGVISVSAPSASSGLSCCRRRDLNTPVLEAE